MSDIVLGKLIKGPAKRDALHFAVAPVTAAHGLIPGDRIGFVDAGNTQLVGGVNQQDQIGIVDPFLFKGPAKGERFYMILFPNTVTGMRHEWQHPAFAVDESAQWLERFAGRWGFNHEEMIYIASEAPDSEWNYITAHGHDLHSREELGEDYDLFWKHLEVVKGKSFDSTHREKVGWSCSC